jgi:hypothetical protein
VIGKVSFPFPNERLLGQLTGVVIRGLAPLLDQVLPFSIFLSCFPFSWILLPFTFFSSPNFHPIFHFAARFPIFPFEISISFPFFHLFLLQLWKRLTTSSFDVEKEPDLPSQQIEERSQTADHNASELAKQSLIWKWKADLPNHSADQLSQLIFCWKFLGRESMKLLKILEISG